MSVLIKGMEMPKNCAECERWSICKCLNDYEDYESILYAVEDGDLVRNKNCPLIEVPPHGRLIDADFEEQHYTSMTTNPTPDVTEQDKHNSLVIVRALQMAKTVIEAED